jgi:hypothetical protein
MEHVVVVGAKDAELVHVGSTRHAPEAQLRRLQKREGTPLEVLAVWRGRSRPPLSPRPPRRRGGEKQRLL